MSKKTIDVGIGTALGGITGGLGTGLIESNQRKISGKRKKPAAAIEMPSMDSPDVEAAKRRSIAMQLSRKGRASTILTGGL